MGDPLIAVYSACYNQSEYIADAIESFLSQKTQYPYHIYMHDDASTDSTVEILQQYASKYQNKITLLLEKENQHSQKIDYLTSFIMQTDSKYIAFCDGDDYWIDETKLQKQTEYMEDHPECVCCTTEAKVRDYFKNTEYLCMNIPEDQNMDPRKILSWQNLASKPSSWLLRVDPLRRSQDLILKMGGNSDFPLCLFMAGSGMKIYYMSKPMICYRFGAKGSWTVAHSGSREMWNQCIDTLKIYDRETHYINHKYLKSAIWKGRKNRFLSSFIKTPLGRILRKIKRMLRR